jgi:hypothetical protein
MYTRDPNLMGLNEEALVATTLLITFNTPGNEVINYQSICDKMDSDNANCLFY